MGEIRPLILADIPAVTDLHKRIMFDRCEPSSQAERSYWEQLLFHNPWYDESIPSLVYEETGKIIGFLGVLPRRMSLNDQPIRAALSISFVVDQGSRALLAAIQLIKRFLAGPQDLSFCDQANHVSRKILEAAGYTTALPYSIYWTLPLKPGRYALSYMAKARLLAPIDIVGRPFFNALDRLAVRLPHSPFRRRAPQVSGEELTNETHLLCLAQGSTPGSLRADYDESTLEWAIHHLRMKRPYGTMRKMVLRDSRHQIIGWYIYDSKPGDVGQVVQVGANDGLIDLVLDHLFYDAWQQGCVALSGRLEPHLVKKILETLCLFQHQGWMLVHSRDPEISTAIHSGSAYLTRLEGEWSV